MLSDRKKKILCAVIDGYIETSTPISSKDIQEGYVPECSSATIRNEMSALESMGYLAQPHVSAGRVPTELAFRFYANELMSRDPLTQSEIDVIEKYFSQKITSVEEVVEAVAHVISDVTNYTSVVVKEDLSDCITSIKLLDLSNGKMLVVIVTDARLLKDAVVDIPESFTTEMLQTAENWLNRLFVGRHVSDFLNFNYPLAIVNSEFEQFNVLFKKIIDVLRKVSLAHGTEVVTDGSNKIFNHSEYKNSKEAQNFLSTLEHKERLAEIFCDGDESGCTIKIGTEDNAPDGCSVVSTKITLGESVSGSIGVIGPVRMNYRKVVSVLDRVSAILSKILDGDKNEGKQD